MNRVLLSASLLLIMATSRAEVLAQSSGFTRQVGVSHTAGTPVLRFYGMRDAFPGQCEADCARDPACMAYTYVRPGGYNAGDPPMCYLFSQAGSTANNDCCTSGQRTSLSTQPSGFGPWQNGMDLQGAGDYRSFALPQPNPELCLAECARDARCRAVTYTRPGTYGNPSAACWLKAGTGSLAPHANAMSAIKRGDVAPPPSPPVAAPPPPPVDSTSLTGEWIGPTRYSIVQTGTSFRWTAFGGAEIGEGTISGNDLQATWTGGGAATGRITERTPQGLPIAIQWSNGVQFRRVGDTGGSGWPAPPPPPPVVAPPPPPPPPVDTTSLTGEWIGPTRYSIVQTGTSFRWTAFGGAEIGEGTISGNDLQATWTGGGAATGRITERTPQGLPMAIQWSNGVRFTRVGNTGGGGSQTSGCDDIKGHWFYRVGGSGSNIYVFHEILPPGSWAVGGFEVDVKFPGHADRWGPVRCLGNNRFEFKRSDGNTFFVATLRDGKLVQDDGTHWSR